ncbi:Hypothetical protein P9211_00451 [Prochlorococcus marinus str. MIT 9211]|uniref:Uncharacterized protein n=1 Tax=Prochlorococcus marinus (strain MIT 9211) TaxID=93059 RepID=A9B9D9_PROM4|nr:Hypothetical protein P9211_00451 [Prochlorococcus marinus str. MIT 9211]
MLNLLNPWPEKRFSIIACLKIEMTGVFPTLSLTLYIECENFALKPQWFHLHESF